MSVAPISEAGAESVPYSQEPESRAANPAAKSLPLLLIPVLLAIWPGRAYGQQQAPQFDDLAARAAAARDQENIPLAINLYTQAEQLKPDWVEGWFYLGQLQYGSNNFPAAIEAFNRALQLKPGAAPALALRGLCEFETGAYDDALNDLDQAVKNGAANDPRHEQIVRFHYALLLAHAGRFQAALLQYKALAAKPIEDPDILLGLCLAGMRNATLPKDVPAQSREPLTEAGRAAYAFFSDDSQLADNLFNKLFAGYPTMQGLHFFYGNLLSTHGPELAIPQFQAEVDLNPSNVAARALLAYWLMYAGRFAEARPQAEQAAAAAPDMEIVQITLGRSLAETGDPQRAAELLNQVLKIDPNNLEAHLGLAVVYARTGRREDAYRERMVCLGLEK